MAGFTLQVHPLASHGRWWGYLSLCFVLVELDDASHDRADRRARDAFLDEVLAGVGLPILHQRLQRRYHGRALAVQIATVMGGAAPTPPPQIVGPAQPVPPPALASARQPLPVVATPAIPLGPTCGQCHAGLADGAKCCTQCGALFGL